MFYVVRVNWNILNPSYFSSA